MKYVSLPTADVYPLPFYLAMEEYIAHRADIYDDMFFVWRVKPTVIIGRNQNLLNEVNLEYCRAHDINVVRRKSGGGCVYADMDNVMLSCVQRCSSPVQTVFADYTESVAKMLRALGIAAEASSRNDITINGRKVSGNAFYHLPGRSIVHGTMLYNLDIDTMTAAITPSTAKLEWKGVESVRSRVTSLKEYTTLSLEDFMAYVREYLCDGELRLTADDVAEIDRLSQPYYSDRYLYGRKRLKAERAPRRVGNAGEFVGAVSVIDGVINDVNLWGDYFHLDDVDKVVGDRLRGVSYDECAVAEALAEVNVGNVVSGLTNDELIKLLF